MNGATVPYDIIVSGYELLERRIDVVEIDVGDEAVDAGIDAGGFLAMHITPRGDEIGKRPEIGEPARHRGIGMVAADALVVIALGIERLRLGQAFFRQARMLAQQRVAELMPVTFVLPARIRHHPVEVVEHARDQKVRGSLCRRQRRIDRQPVFLRDIGKDGLAVTDRIVTIDDVRQLTARRLRGVENMLLPERHARQLEECKYLQAVAVVVGDAEQRGVGVKREHAGSREDRGTDKLQAHLSGQIGQTRINPLLE